MRLYRWIVLDAEDGDISLRHPKVSLGDSLRGNLRGDGPGKTRLSFKTKPIIAVQMVGVDTVVLTNDGEYIILGAPERNI